MEVKQIYGLMNDVTKEILGDTAIINEDLSNIVDVGTAILNATEVDKYVKSLVNHIGKVIFVNRPYRGSAPKVVMDGWEYGSICEKIRAKLPEATENESWELEDGTSYDQDVFYKPTVYAKFFNKMVTFEIPMSFTEKQVKQSLSNVRQLNSFLSMLYNEVDKSMTIKLDALVKRTINNMIGETIYSDYSGAALSSKSGVKAVNLLYLYNQTFSESLTFPACMTDSGFIRFASYVIGNYMDKIKEPSTLFNVGMSEKFTDEEYLHIILLSEFVKAADVYLQSSTFHDNFTKLPLSEEVACWQGSGSDFSISNTSKIDIKTTSGHTITTTGIIGVMFDRDALGVTNMDKRVKTHYNNKAEFFNNWFKMDAGYFNDLDENFVVFFAA